ncbi:MAG: hypothetical protein VW378_02460 [bacterium]
MTLGFNQLGDTFKTIASPQFTAGTEAVPLQSAEFTKLLAESSTQIDIKQKIEQLQTIKKEVELSQLDPQKKEDALALIERLLSNLNKVKKDHATLFEQNVTQLKQSLLSNLLKAFSANAGLSELAEETEESDTPEEDMTIDLLGNRSSTSPTGMGIFDQYQGMTTQKQFSSLFDMSKTGLNNPSQPNSTDLPTQLEINEILEIKKQVTRDFELVLELREELDKPY